MIHRVPQPVCHISYPAKPSKAYQDRLSRKAVKSWLGGDIKCLRASLKNLIRQSHCCGSLLQKVPALNLYYFLWP
jgi:hypothetical protein